MPAPGREAFPHSPVRKSGVTKWRTLVLIAVHLFMIVHIAQWLIHGLTVSPVEPSESMYTLEVGRINAGFVFFSLALLSTLVFGRFFCGWGCHMVAFQDLCGHIMTRLGVRPRMFRSRLLLWVPLLLAGYMFVWPAVRREVLWPASNWVGHGLFKYLFTDVAPCPSLVQWTSGMDLGLPWWVGEAFHFPGFRNSFIVEDYWATFPPWWMTFPFLLTCTFAMVYFLGSKALCNYACPYGGFFGLVDRVSLGHIVVDDKCNQCGHCTAVCSSNVRVHQEVRDYGMVVDPGCLKCVDCISVCPKDALSFRVGRPAFLTAPRTAAPGPARARRPEYDLAPWQELAVLGAGLLVFYCWRSAWNQIPMLMAASIGAIGGFAVWKVWSILRVANVRLQSLQLKAKGSLRAPGVLFLVACVVFFATTAWLGWVRTQRRAADGLDAGITVDQSVVFRAGYQPTAQNRTDALRAVALYERSGPRDAGGYGWNLTPDQWNRIAWLKAVAGDLAGAAQAVERGMSEGNPKEELVLSARQIFALQGKPNEEFAASLKRVLAANPRAEHVRVALAYTRLQQGKTDEAVDLFNRVLGPGERAEPQAVYRCVDALMQLGRTDEAVAGLDQQIKDRPWAWELLELRAAISSMQGRPEEAAALLQRATGRASKNPGLWVKLSEARRAAGDEAGADAAQKIAEDLQRQQPPPAR